MKTRIESQPSARVPPTKGRLRFTSSPPITRPPCRHPIGGDNGGSNRQAREEDLYLTDANAEDGPGRPAVERDRVFAVGMGFLCALGSQDRRGDLLSLETPGEHERNRRGWRLS